jgi:undecaprenyl-diphosphatase
MEALLNWDSSLFLHLNRIHSAWWDTAMLFITRKESWLPLYLMLLFLIIRNYKGKSWLIVLFLLLGLVCCDQFCNVTKELVHRYRPGNDPVTGKLTHIVLRKGGDYGFPSSHAANTFYLMAFTGYLFRNRIGLIVMLAWALLVSYSRIYVGAHYPLDLLAGWVIGIAAGWGFYRLMNWVEMKASGGRRQVKIKALPDAQAGIFTLVFITVILTLLTTVYILHKYKFL